VALPSDTDGGTIYFLDLPKKSSNYKGSGKRKIMRNDCQHHETQMGIRLESWELDPKWVL
ncbi:MAG: hypothetical protein MJK14_24145, partial [Rivularia sp. ALOHA_DT_140]|nr:hypothetical protein [Rivularia sp. ALOHA_DT_140]